MLVYESVLFISCYLKRVSKAKYFYLGWYRLTLFFARINNIKKELNIVGVVDD